jgi:hypothetical protein
MEVPMSNKLVMPGSEKPPAEEKTIKAGQNADEKTVLNVLFPEEEVPIKEVEDLVVVVRPLSLEDLPKVSDAFGVLLRYAMAGYDPVTIAAQAFGELAKLIPFCINVPVNKIPASYGPEIMEIIVKQNMTEDVIKKWTALVEKVNQIAEQHGVLSEDQGENPPMKKT